MSTAVIWFRKCLRLHDNPSLTEISENNDIDFMLPVFILDPEIVGHRFEKLSKNRFRFLLESLEDLDSRLKSKANNPLIIFWGSPVDATQTLLSSLNGVKQLFSTDYCSEPYERIISSEISEIFKTTDASCHFHPAAHTILDLEMTIASTDFKNPKSMKDILKIFSSTFPKDKDGFFQLPKSLPEPSKIKNAPSDFLVKELSKTFSGEVHSVLSLKTKFEKLGFFDLPEEYCYFRGGETEALKRLSQKISSQPDYVNSFRKPKTSSTNLPSNALEPSTTGLSAYIATGTLSVRLLWDEVEKANRQGPHTVPPESLHGQLLFREMFYLLSLTVSNWDNDQNNSMCKMINWGEKDESKLSKWSEGNTGFPLIDALMRQLDATGWMHHLGRHAVSCFLTRGQLWQHWKHGRDVFDFKLLDGDWALNNANWLWLSGVAPFSMPYFRLYNPCPDAKSSLNVDAVDADFIKYWIPELRNFPVKHIYEPHLASIKTQKESGCIIGINYPFPIVDRKESSKKNLTKFKASIAKNRLL